ncbi:hypothetical protein [Segatella bryantii]|uniref:hypothetical protein n=1 Tax=Segatella bryantii TaxID=77095 RepID=UPI0024303940|nr:hypothetical protein [Segatella bryantii]
MVTNNLKKIYATRMSSRSSPSVELTNIDGTTYSYSVGYVIPAAYSLSGRDNNCYIAVGSGNTAPTINDVSLENEITTLSNNGIVLNNNENGITYTAILTNNTNADITIKEYGLYVYSGGYKMLTRTVLDNPITLASGEIVSITINIAF